MDKALILLLLLKTIPASFLEKQPHSLTTSKKTKNNLVGVFSVVGTLDLRPRKGKVNLYDLTKQVKKDRDFSTRTITKRNQKISKEPL